MAVVKKLADWPRQGVRRPPVQTGAPLSTAEIYILPCIRREPISEAPRP